MAKVEILVTIEDAAGNSISKIADDCRAAGMSIEQQMSGVGMISGTIEKSNIGKLRQIKGVTDVEESKPISIN